jgi:hypothetical protein
MTKVRNAFRILVAKYFKTSLKRTRRVVGFEDEAWKELAQEHVTWRV